MQDNSLYNTTIRENLEYAKEGATYEELKDALSKAEANFVFDLEK
jgi:ABC-type multidrug transport system fused ATPase/permease subunit